MSDDDKDTKNERPAAGARRKANRPLSALRVRRNRTRGHGGDGEKNAARAAEAADRKVPGHHTGPATIVLGVNGGAAGEEEAETPSVLPVVPVRDVVLFNFMFIPLFITREKSAKAVESCMETTRQVLVLTQKDEKEDDPLPKSLYSVGTVVRVLKMLRLPDGRVKALVQGTARARVQTFTQIDPFMEARIEVLKEPRLTIDAKIEAMMRLAKDQCEKVLNMRGLASPDLLSILQSIDEPGRLADLIASTMHIKPDDAQAILETDNPVERLQKVTELLVREVEVTTMQMRIQNTAREGMDKAQKDYFLREQIKAIRQELGTPEEDEQEELDRLKKALGEAGMPEDVKKEADRQLRRLSLTHSDSAEASVLRNYLELMSELPWSRTSEDNLDITNARETLDADHYGLDKVKDRILEFLSVYKLKPEAGGSIMCFAGPPGVGKTSLGRSIARALGRKFERISLGGIHDEAEIRGHRRTYIGALPGRIIQSLRHAGTRNPVIVLDEIDKVGRDVQGDPQSALLEVLDPEQNSTFSDHYLGVPFDLSKVLFLCTANTLDTIPAALRDRMEIIQLPGYTQQEKLEIAKRHLLAKCVEKNGLEDGDVTIPDETIEKVIREYTREAGVRSLERTLGALCRKMARRKAEGEKPPFEVKPDDLLELLGPPVFLDDEDSMTLSPGMCYGLAWTQAGGEVLTIEAAIVKGKGTIQLTGSLGDVMKESAEAATTFLRSQAKQYHFDPDFLAKHDIHIHVPDGATPKDGPSAGVTLTTALLSALIGKAPKSTLCMTGEIDIKGRVLPVGGIKEKILGAVARGLKEAIIPWQNKKDLYDIPKDLLKKIKIHPVHSYAEVAKLAFTTAALKGRTAGKREKEQAPVVPMEQSLPGVQVTPEENEKQEAPES